MSDWERAARAYDEAEEKRRATAEAIAEIEAAEAARQRQFAEHIDGYVQEFLEAMARAGNPGSVPWVVPTRLWPSKKYWDREVGRAWVYTSPTASLRSQTPSSELAVCSDGTWNVSYPSRFEPPGNANAARNFADGLTGERVDPSVVEWVLKTLTRWLRENGVPLPT
jgi:hypothetical protein